MDLTGHIGWATPALVDLIIATTGLTDPAAAVLLGAVNERLRQE